MRTKTKKTTTVKCPRCDGMGYIGAFGHVANGICFCCNGEKTIEIDIAAKRAKLSADTIKKSDWIMASTPDDYKNLSFAKLSKIDSFSCGGWGLQEVYPNLRSRFIEVGRSFFIDAQEAKFAEQDFSL